MHDLAVADEPDASSFLGEWQLIARTTPEGVQYFRSFSIKYGFESDGHLEYFMSGRRRFGSTCDIERGELAYSNNDVYTHSYKYSGLDRKYSRPYLL